MLKKSLRWSLIYLLEAVAALLALVIFGVGAVLWRLSSGPVELEFLREDAQRMLADAFEGEVVALGQLEARFDTQSHALVLTARDVAVADAQGEVITRAPRIEAGLAADALLLGRMEPVSFEVEGGSLSFVRRLDGAVGAGLGSVARVTAQARLPERGGDDSASLFQILEEPQTATSRLGRLNHISIRDTSVNIVDAQSGIAWLIDDAGVIFRRDEDRLQLDIEGAMATPSGFALVDVRLEAGADLESLLLSARVEGLSPAGVLPGSGLLAPLRALDAPVSLDIAMDATRDSGIRNASLTLDVGEGSILTDGETRLMRGARFSAGFDPVSSVLTVHEGVVDSDLMQVSLTGQVTDLGGYVGALPMRGHFQLEVGEGFVDIGPVFEVNPQWESLVAEGDLRLDEFAADLTRLTVDISGITAELTGSTRLEERPSGLWLPHLRLNGPILGDVPPETVLAYWPVELADSAREWVAERILGGRFYNAQFDLDLLPEDIENEFMENERLTLSFDFENAHVLYISTMSPLEEATGRAVLRGNAFEVALSSGRIGNIRLTEGFVDIPRLNPKGAVARYGGLAHGPAADILGLIDEEPLFLVSNYGIDPASVGGEGEMRFEIRRAMLTDVPPEEIPFFVDGAIENASLDIPGLPYSLSEGSVEISASQGGLEARGTAVLMDTPVAIRWHEQFGLPEGEPSTRIELDANVSARTLDAFNIPVRRWFDGPVMVTASAVSDGLDFQAIDLHADLTDALLELPGSVWGKPAGEAGTADITLSTDEDGRYLLDRISLAAPGLQVEAVADLSPQGRLEHVAFETFQLEGLADVEGDLIIPSAAGSPLEVLINGRYLDISDFVARLTSLGEGGGGIPLDVDINVARVILSERSVLDDFNLIWRSEEAGVRAVSIEGRAIDGPFQAFFGAREPGGARDFHVQAQSVERIASVFGWEDYAMGGRLAILGSAPPLGTEGPLTARMEISDLTLIRVPVLARILAAGSFQGLAALLNGEGITFEQVEADFLYEEGLLTIGEARAAGNSLGVTAAGTVDFRSEIAAIDGNLAPSYVVNSLFADVPVIGDILVSRPGEGVIGITYSVEGPFDSLTVFANPLAVFAPGVLRRIFEGTAAERAARERAQRGAAEPEEAQPDAPQPDEE
ncbi:DUF3971 domain-containing protein [Maricaulis parjimensis]|uniref:DUF3971 domain-containing protein n=1 Tax=Maricaulis parjimensis TaxID=144023 RepID=UPI0019394BB9|nr:AsmA-like C-terminal region-containing protein [Maricaulis parjimensis]